METVEGCDESFSDFNAGCRHSDVIPERIHGWKPRGDQYVQGWRRLHAMPNKAQSSCTEADLYYAVSPANEVNKVRT